MLVRSSLLGPASMSSYKIKSARGGTIPSTIFAHAAGRPAYTAIEVWDEKPCDIHIIKTLAFSPNLFQCTFEICCHLMPLCLYGRVSSMLCPVDALSQQGLSPRAIVAPLRGGS